MQNVSRDLQAALRGCSAKEQNQQELLDRVTQERAIGSLVQRGDVSALVVQRIWRGRTVARKVAAQARVEWDEKFLSRHSEDESPVSANVISNQILRPLFMILKPSSPFNLRQIAEDAGRLTTCFRLLLQSIHNPGRSFDYVLYQIIHKYAIQLLQFICWVSGRNVEMDVSSKRTSEACLCCFAKGELCRSERDENKPFSSSRLQLSKISNTSDGFINGQ